jgi:methyl-accepting chemotaxis protein/methyl-accepting chemotaxis protein-1 (serine sensor receptor)
MKFDMTVGRKFAASSAAMGLLTLILGGIALYNISGIQKNFHEIAKDSLPGVYEIGRVDSMVWELRGNYWKHMASTDKNLIAQTDSANAQVVQKAEAALSAYEKTITNDEDRRLFEAVKTPFERYTAAWESQVAPISRQGEPSQAIAKYMEVCDPVHGQFKPAVRALIDFNKAKADHDAAATEAAVAQTRFWTMFLLGLSTLTGGLLVFFIVRSVNRSLNVAISELSQGAEQVASAAAQVATSSQSLAQGSSEQAASLEETSASGEEINSMAQQNAQNSHAAADLVSQSQVKFEQTNRALEQMVVVMGGIKASSDKIANIIKTIDEIAFQTNILALNAAVEAARAGEAGLGFAVVADEVRNLAQRCAQAAKGTAELIEESISRSQEGKTSVDQVAASIRAITEESARVKALVDQVNRGSEEQARGTEQISKAMSQMEQVTHGTAAGAEQCASAAEELTGQSAALRGVVERLTAMVHGA